MCYIFSCFAWALDFLQRTITFILACILCFIIVIGIVVAIAAGVAYGYNYSMAEFLTFTRQDTTVYMRRGQFYDKPDFESDRDVVYARRAGQMEPRNMQMNASIDYLEVDARRSEGKGLPEAWRQVKDNRKYVEMLSKFNRIPETDEEVLLAEEEDLARVTEAANPSSASILAAKRISIAPNPRVVSTTVLENGPVSILMRNYKPLATKRYPTVSTRTPELNLEVSPEPQKPLASSNSIKNSGEKVEGTDDLNRINADSALYSDERERYHAAEDRHTKIYQQYPTRSTAPRLPPMAVDKAKERRRPTVQMRHWGASKASVRTEPYTIEYKDDIDEDNVVYKPI